MSKMIILSDIHANWNALSALWQNIEERYEEPGTVFCLGDVVGYGPSPIDCWEWVYEHTNQYKFFRLGNHDACVGRWEYRDRFNLNPHALLTLAVHRAILRQKTPDIYQHLREMNRENMRDKYQQPYQHDVYPYRFFLAHGDFDSEPDLCSAFARYLKGAHEIQTALLRVSEQKNNDGNSAEVLILIVGHTHLPMFAFLDDQNRLHFEEVRYNEPISLAEWEANLQQRHGIESYQNVKAIFLNPGSVGQPRDGVGQQSDDTVAAHALRIDTEKHTIEFINHRYDVFPVISRLRNIVPSEYLEDVDLKQISIDNIDHYWSNDVFYKLRDLLCARIEDESLPYRYTVEGFSPKK